MNCKCKDVKTDRVETDNYLSLLDNILNEYKTIEGSLITILQKAQDIYGYLPQEVLKHISDGTGIKLAKILGVVTFYTQFRLKPAGKYLILLCQGTACHVNGSSTIEETVLSFLSTPQIQIKEGDTTPDGLFTLQNVACIGCCSLSPVMMINGETYGMLMPDKTKQVLQDIINLENSKSLES